MPVIFSSSKPLGRLPRLGTGAITAFCCYKLRISQTFSDHTLKSFNKSPLIVVFALVESERLLIAVTEQMKRLNVYICAFERAFQKRPEVFQSVSVNLAACVAFQVVNDLAVIIFFKVIIGHKRIGAYGRTCFDLLANIAAKFRTARCLNGRWR